MKYFFATLLVATSWLSFGQTNSQDFTNLVKLGDIYSSNVNATGTDFKKSIEELRTPGLNHIIDALIAVGKGDKKLLTKEFLSKPPEQELKYWYVIREIHFNNQPKNSNPKPSEVVAKETLDDNIDSRYLLDNYYYRIRGGIAKMFNDKNLSRYNIDLDDLGLETETEKAILFFAISGSLTERFRVLQMMKNSEKLLEFASKLPTFNDKPYYEFVSFDFDDFDWTGYDAVESYKAKHLASLYSVLDAHFSALAEKEKWTEMRKLYVNSILYIPDYFQYAAGSEKELQELYDQSKK